ncbi:MAG: zf-TFIIB domain-containing protein [Armatimonadetes bacterium]|nr:zf-TFIIB domain-containing protein [Armatimonadota bacterium]
MDRCPTCGLLLETTSTEGRNVQGCRECGGLLFDAGDLAALAKHQPQALGELEHRYNATLLAGSRAGQVPQCGRCHEPMKERSFPKAPDLPMYTCGKCKLVWLRDGQADALQAAVAPDLLKPRWAQAVEEQAEVAAAAAEEEVDDAELREANGYGPLGLWPERLDGQPWASWFVCGMPLWMAPLLLFVAGLILWGTLSADPETAPFAIIGVVVPFAIWPMQSIAMSLALQVTWLITDDSPGLSAWETLVLMIRVVPTAFLGGVIADLLALITGTAGAGMLAQLIVTVIIYRRVMELEWRDIYILGFVSTFLGAGMIGTFI